MNLGYSYTDPPITVACNRAEGLLCDKVHVRTAATLICHVLMLPNGYIRLIYIVDGLPSIYRGLTVGSGRLLSCSSVCAALQACTIWLPPCKWSLVQHRILWKQFWGDLRSLHWNCAISSFLLPSRHKSLMCTSYWAEIAVVDVITCHTPLFQTHRDMTCLYVPVFMASSSNEFLFPSESRRMSQRSRCDCITRNCVWMRRNGPLVGYSDWYI